MNKNEEISSALAWRYATKKYASSKPISAADWSTLTDAIVKAPTSYGLQALRVLDIESPDLRAKLREVSWGQSIITEASKLIVFLSKEKVDEPHIQKYIDRIADVRGVPKDSLNGFRDMMFQNVAKGMSLEASSEWARRQTYIALGFFLETAALLRIDATPVEGFDAKAYDKILGLEGTGWRSAVVATVGYRHAEDATQNYKKVRFETASLIEKR